VKPWLTIVGVGLDGPKNLSDAARAALAAADIVAGGQRHCSMLGVDEARRYIWPRPFSDGVAHILAQRGRELSVVVLATGDPMHFGVGAKLVRGLERDEFVICSAPSAFSLAAGRLGWPIEEAVCMSVHGRPIETLLAWTNPGSRILALTGGGTAPIEISEMLTGAGYGATKMCVLENLGGVGERVISLTARECREQGPFAALNVVALECRSDEGVGSLSRLAGLPDDAFEHDGQITKRDVRAATLAALAPVAGEHLWDVGAGCGSVAIEWLRSGNRMAATAFEKDARRLAMIEANARQLGVPDLQIVPGVLPQSLEGIPLPDAVFHGGGVSDDAVFEAAWSALRSGGRFVANAVTLEGEAALVKRQGELGGALVRMAVSTLEAVGQFRGLRPGMAVMQWRVEKP